MDTMTGYAAAAAAWRAAGWLGILPLPTRSKTPPPTGYTGVGGRWPTDETIAAWAATTAGNACLRLPDNVIGVDIDAYDARPGAETLGRLESHHGRLPPSWTVTSRTDGMSGIRLYAVPPGIRWRGEAGPGIDIIQHRHRYAVIPPSIHPEGREYVLIGPGGELHGPPPTADQLPPLPAAWIAQLREPELEPEPQRPAAGDNLGPLDRFKRRATVDDLRALLDGLGAHSWRPVGDQWHCTRPGKPDGTSAVIGLGPNGQPGNVTHVHSTNWPGLPPGTYTASDLLVAAHRGDSRAASREIIENEGWRPPTDTSWLMDATRQASARSNGADPVGDENDWQRHDLVGIVTGLRDGTHAIETPTIMPVDGGKPLLYRARIHTVFGESGGGKSWFALGVALEQTRNGQRVLWIDFEDSAIGLAERLRLLGATNDQIARIDYRAPATGLLAGFASGLDPTYDLVVIDSWGEAMAASAVKQNDDDAVAQWVRIVKRFSAAGAAVLLIDHIPKAVDAPQLFGIGSQRKRAAITGAAYRVDTVVEPAVGKSGVLKLRVAKDRLGTRPKGSIACEVHLISHDDGARITIECRATDAQKAAERGERFRPTYLMEQISRLLEETGELPRTKIEERVEGRRNTIRAAIDVLIDDGYAREFNGAKSARVTVIEKPYRAAADQLAGDLAPTSPHLAPPRPDLAPGEVENPGHLAPDRTPPLRGGSSGARSDRMPKGDDSNHDLAPGEVDPWEGL
jgi:hypothetical protein